MPILNIEPATRRGMRFLVSLYGLSETGKTHSALLLAAGLEPDPKKRGLLDCEGGERGRAYVDDIPGGYMYAAMSAPFTPERYIEAMREFEAAGVNALVIDSVSHAWFAAGGILDMVENATEKNDMAKWAKPKRRLSKMTQALLSSNMHIILCSRAKQPLIEVEGPNGKLKLVPGPVIPIQEKTLKYDMTIMARMLGDGAFTIDRAEGGKCPMQLRSIFAQSERMGIDTGQALIKWLGEQTMKAEWQRQLDREAETAAEAGTNILKAFFLRLTREQQLYLKPQMEGNYKSVAAAADRDEEERSRSTHADGDPPYDPFGPTPETTGASINISHVGDRAPAPGPTFQTPIPEGELTRQMDAIQTKDELAAWRKSPEVTNSFFVLDDKNAAAWSRVTDYYEGRREALAELENT